MVYWVASLSAAVIAWVVTPALITLAWKIDLLDRPRGRHQHASPTPLLGGLGILLSVVLVAIFCLPELTATKLTTTHWLGVFIGSALLIIGGYLDDKYQLKPWQQIIWPVAAALALIAGGVGIEKLTNPFGGFIYMDAWQIQLWSIAGRTYYLSVWADLLLMVWILAMIYTTKLLDGVDGLVTGISGIAALIIFAFTQSQQYFQPDISLAAVILAGACLGFLVYNWHPAKSFLGEGGSMLLGFLLGVLSIISGAKIAIALLIMGLPMLDVVWTIIRRLLSGKNPFVSPDRRHLHFLLIDSGWGVRRTVVFFYLIAAIFGSAALFLQARGKLVALGLLVALMLVIVGVFYYLDKKSKVS
jgi:UDP-GlcNAc:undecaprenyl-phosphate GlcNAc-1-phosphate transferase